MMNDKKYQRNLTTASQAQLKLPMLRIVLATLAAPLWPPVGRVEWRSSFFEKRVGAGRGSDAPRRRGG
jgi:hypothetical protein